jgi:small subunit ribosomal protein S15
MLSSQKKSEIITKFAASTSDTGSPQVQIALLSEQIAQLASHLKSHPKDNHSRRGLLKIVSKRRRLLNYLGKSNPSIYQDLIDKVKIG